MSETHTPTLLERLAAIRDKTNQNLYSELDTSFTFAAYLLIYSKANSVYYIYQGRKHLALAKYLTKDFSIPFNFELDKYPDIDNPEVKVPTVFAGWELNTLARDLSGQSKGELFERYKRAIFITSYDLAIRGLL